MGAEGPGHHAQKLAAAPNLPALTRAEARARKGIRLSIINADGIGG
jgi:hypothetical protein